MKFPLTKDFSQDAKNLIGAIYIDEEKINLEELALKMEKGLVEIAPSLIVKDGKINFVDFSIVLSNSKVIK